MCTLVQVALLAQFAYCAWRKPNKCLIIREQVLLSSLHQPKEGVAVTVSDKLLGCERGALIQQWFCRWSALIGVVTAILAVLNWLVDWQILPRHSAVQALTEVALSLCCIVLVVAGGLCSRASVTLKVLRGKPASWYYLGCCTLAWTAMLVWRGPKEGELWWMKTIAVACLSASMLFIDALPIEVHAGLGRIGLTVVSVIAGATYLWLKVRTGEMYSKYEPAENRLAGIVTLSSYKKCCDFLFFQARKTKNRYRCVCM